MSYSLPTKFLSDPEAQIGFIERQLGFRLNDEVKLALLCGDSVPVPVPVPVPVLQQHSLATIQAAENNVGMSTTDKTALEGQLTKHKAAK